LILEKINHGKEPPRKDRTLNSTRIEIKKPIYIARKMGPPVPKRESGGRNERISIRLLYNR